MNSKFFVLTAFLFFNFGCAHSADVAKTDMPEDEMIAGSPINEKPKAETMQNNSRMPASVEDPKTMDVCRKGDKHNSKCSDAQ